MPQLIGVCVGVLTFAAYVVYWRSILTGSSKPATSTWLIWTFASVVISLSYWFEGARETWWASLGVTLGTLVTLVLALKHGHYQWSQRDTIYLAISSLGILAWVFTHNPLYALVLNLLVDLIGALPTVVKTYAHPEQEDLLAWSLTVCANIMNVLVLQTRDFSIALYPWYMLAINGTILLFILRPLFIQYVKRFYSRIALFLD